LNSVKSVPTNKSPTDILKPHGEVLGAHIIGAEATEMIAELGLAITLEATKKLK